MVQFYYLFSTYNLNIFLLPGFNVDFEETRPDPHVVGTLLKMYLRECR